MVVAQVELLQRRAAHEGHEVARDVVVRQPQDLQRGQIELWQRA